MEEPECGTSKDPSREQAILAKLSTTPDNTSLLFELQTCYKEQARYEDEIAILRRILEKDLSPDVRAEALHDLVYALDCQGNQEEAILHAEELISTYRGYRYLGYVFWLLGAMYGERSARQEHLENWRQDVRSAERSLRKALDLVDGEQDRAGVLVELGEALSSRGRLEEARLTFEQALEIGIKDSVTLASCYQRLGLTLCSLDQPEEAKLAFEQSLSVHLDQPSSSRAMVHVDLAGLYREQGDLEGAKQLCLQALQVLAESNQSGMSVALGSIYQELGHIAFQQKKYERAIEDFQTALEQARLPGKRRELYYDLSVALRWDGQHKRALEVLREALALELSLQPPDEERVGEILYHMGDCAYRLYDFQQSVLLLEKAADTVALPDSVEVHLTLAHSYFRLGRYKDAAESYRKVVRDTKWLSPSWRQAMKYLVRARMAR